MYQHSEIIRLAKEGLKPASIVEQVGCSAQYASSVLWEARRNGEDIPIHPGGKPRVEKKLKVTKPAEPPRVIKRPRVAKKQLAAIAMALEGHPPRDIAAALDSSSASISAVLSRARSAGQNIPRNKPGSPTTRLKTPSGRGRGRSRQHDAA